MKVGKGIEPDTFTPIVITLETREEADKMYHILNVAVGGKLSEYCEDEGIPRISKMQMFSDFAEVHAAR